MKYKCDYNGEEYKHQIDVVLKKRERVASLFTNDDDFNSTNIFTSRKSIREIQNTFQVTEIYENGGGAWDSWNEYVRNLGGILNSQEIEDIIIDGKSINDKYRRIAKKHKLNLTFPLLYHFQIAVPYSPIVYNWYPTTGSTTKQLLNQKFSMKKVGCFNDFEELLKYINENI